MIKKLLLFVRSLFLNFSNSSKERSFTPGLRFLCLGMFFVFQFANAATITSKAAGGNWSTGTTWVGNVAPTNTDIVIIATTGGNTVTANAQVTCGGLTINSGAILTMNRDFTVNGITSISGTINFGSSNSTPRVMTFNGAVTLNTGAVWSEASSGNDGDDNTYSFGDNFTNNATTFNALGVGVHTFSGTNKVLNGATSTTIQRVAITGSYTNNINNPAALTVSTALSGGGTLTNALNKTLNIGGSSAITNLNNAGTASISGSGAITTTAANFINTGTLNLGGSGNITGITNNAGGTVNLTSSGTIATFSNATSTSVLQITATSPTITTLTATATGNIVNYSGAAQNIKATSYANLTLSNSGTKTFPASIVAISGDLNINSGVIANLNTFTHTAGRLYLGGATTSAGSWGSTTSTANNKNDTFFAATTGLINVSSPSCTAPVIFAITGTNDQAYCSTEAGTIIGLSGSESGVNYQLYRGTVAVGSPVAGTGLAISFGAFNTTGKYTVKAIRTSLCTATMSGGPITVYKYSSPPTITGTVTHVGCPTSATGKIDITNASNPASLGFVRASTDATTQGVNLGQSLLSNRATFTVEGWIKFDNLNYVTRMSIFGQNNAIEIAFEDDNLRCYTASGGTVDVPKSEITAGLWYHIAVTGDGTAGGLKIYLNGVLKSSPSGIATSNYGSDTNYSTKIGYAVMDAAGNGLTGEIFKVGFWSTALSGTDVAKLATGFVDYDASFSNLIAGYSFNDGPSATSLTGVGSSAPVGTFVNLTTAAWKDPYVYSWTSVPAGYTSAGKNLTGLLPGTYNVTTSLRNCTSSGSFTVNATNTVPSITTPPSATSACVGGNASFSIVGAGTGVNYQWQLSTGGAFANLTNNSVYSNVTTATLNITAVTASMSGYQYRCIVGGTCTPAVTSTAAVLTVNTPSAAPTSIGGTTT
ncbi:hypothetical protein, partial [Flavobacterium sp. LC2016-12]|uniref:beta strand repeat-containing protein n=1 Tax=Flavobacterium sp. LC2016-12 TaxID=2783794 RepID=UPI00188B77EE